MHRTIVFSIILLFIFLTQPLDACEFCSLAFLGKKEKQQNKEQPYVDVKVFYENQDWEEIPADEAHELHHDGHHVHDKQDEQIIHTILKGQLNDQFSLEVDIPYVTRHYIEIDTHAHLGENQTSRGLGDITISGDYRIIQTDGKSLGLIAGVKVPSGETDELSSFGSLIEPELQPGTGSVDYLAGLGASLHPGNVDLSASAVYVYKTQGDQGIRFGDVFSLSLFGSRTINLNDQLKLKVGALMSNQLEKKQNDEDGDIKDSGGYTMLLGPLASLNYKQLSAEVSYLFPAVQKLGGVHQELDLGIWTGALSVKF